MQFQLWRRVEGWFALAVVCFLAPLSSFFSSYAIASNDSRLEEVFVRARKIEERLLDVPLSISTFSQQELESPLLDNISNLDKSIPNFVFESTAPISGSGNASVIYIRGIGQNDFLLTNDPGVAVYLDGVYVARSIGGVLGLSDLESIEVIKGPQGSLFGKNTVGGAIQAFTRMPDEELSVKAHAIVGSFERRDYSASIEGGISDTVSGRFSFGANKRDGHVRRIIDGAQLGTIDTQVAKGIFRWQPNEDADFYISVDHTRQRQTSPAESLVDVNSDAALVGLFNNLLAPVYGNRYDNQWVTPSPFTTNATGPLNDDLDLSGVVVNGEVVIAKNLTLNSITGYREQEATFQRDADGSPLPFAHLSNRDEQEQYSQEWRLDYGGDRWKWNAGIFYFYEDAFNHQDVVIAEGALLAGGPDLEFSVNNGLEVDSRALFGQLTHLMTEHLSVTAGLRRTREAKTFTVNNFAVNSEAQIIGPLTRPDDVWWNSSATATIDYNFSNTNYYFSVSEGFKSGGYNGRLLSPRIDDGEPQVDNFNPEEVLSFELGFKKRWQRIYMQTSVFSNFYDNMQVTVLNEGSNGVISPEIENAAESRIDGAEMEFDIEVTSHWGVSAGVGYLDARFTKIAANSDLDKSLKLQKVPDWSGFLSLNYERDLYDFGQVGGQLEWRYRGKVYNDPKNEERIAQPSHSLLDASLSWEPSETLRLELFGTNLTDKEYVVGGSTALGGSTGLANVTYARPREWGLKLSFKHR